MESANFEKVPNSVEDARNMEVNTAFAETESRSCSSRRPSENFEDVLSRAPNEGNNGLTVFSSLSTTPTSGTDYQSCSDPSTPERKTAPEELGPAEGQAEVACNVNMSANIASKLNQIRASLENLDFVSECSFDDLEVAEEVAGPTIQETGSHESLSSARRSSSKPSLRQVFPYIPCLPFENNIVFCFVLSVWDNIVGPQTVYVWKRKSFPSQKNIDDMIDGKERIDVGDVSRNTVQPLPQYQQQIDGDTFLDNSSHQRSEDKTQSRKLSDHLEHNDKSDSVDWQAVNNSHSDNLGKQSLNSRERKVSGNNQSRHASGDGSLHSLNIGEEEGIAKDRGSFREARNVERNESGHNLKAKPGMAQNPSGSSGEGDIQEFGSSWVCGRGRLRMGAVVRYVTEHSVGVGQVGPPSEKILSSLLVVPHQGIIIVAARFTVAEDDCGVPYCLSLVVPLEEYEYFLPLTNTVTTWLISIAATTRLLITKYGLEGGGRIKNKLVELCDILVALRSASLDQYPLTPAGRPPDDRRLAEIILTSHLQTLGSTLVVADSPNAANKVVMWIAQFSDPSELPVSRLCLSYTQWSFHPGLSIQGIVRSSNGEVNLSAQKLIQSSRPLTVVDISRGTVKQTGPPDIHARRNVAALHQELLSLWHELPDISAPSESLLEPVRAAAPLVKQFLHDYDRLISCDGQVRQNFIRAFLRSLQYTALAIITWTQHEWAVQRRRSGYDTLKQALCSVFDLDDLDLRIVLAQAELLQPGFYSYAMT